MEPINAPNPKAVATAVFDGATEEDVDDALVHWAKNGDCAGPLATL